MRRPVAAKFAGEPRMLGGDLAGFALQPVAEHDAVVAGRPRRGLAPRQARRPAERRSDSWFRQRSGSPGFGDSLPGSSSARLTASGRSSRYLRTIARASASVVGSGTVGPEPITAGSSPGTSEMASVTTRAGWARRASRPPLMRERCLRTQLISPILAPLRRSARVVACLSASVMPVAGAIQIGRRAAGKQHQDEIVRARRVGKFEHAFGAVEAGLVGHRVSGLDHGNALGRPAIAVAGDGDPVEPASRNAREIMPFGRFGQRAGAFAGGQAR